jgi:diguanylate cyclase (GGDEF)-like protein
MKKYKNLFWIPAIILLILMAWLSFNTPVNVTQAVSHAGVLNLNQWDESSILQLRGDWDYYDGLMIKDVASQTKEKYVYVPHIFAKDGSSYGVATYGLHVEGLEPHALYGIKIMNEASAYRLTVNGKDVLKEGTVAYTKEGHEPEMKEKLGFFQSDVNGNADILMEISNFSYHYGGFWKEIWFGKEDVILGYTLHRDGIDIFLATSIFVLGLFFLVLYSINRDFKPVLFFSIIALLIAARVLLTNDKQFYYVIYNFSWDIGTRLEFLIGYLLLPVFGLFFYSLEYIKKIKPIKWIYIGMIFAFFAVTVFTPNEFYANLLPYYINLCLGCIGFFIYIIIQGIRKKKTGAVLILLGQLGFIPTVLYDFYMNSIYYIMPVGLYFLFICFSIVVFRNVFQIKKKNDYLEEAIVLDPLTGLKNRYFLNNLMDQGFSVPQNLRLYILFFDLDRFKEMNDTYGHHVGDSILIESTKRIKECLHRESDIVCRYGGDEFIAFVQVRDQEGNIQKIIDRILNKYKEPIFDQGNKYMVSVSIGVSEYKEGDDLEKIIKESDDAMYQKKKSMPEGIVFLNKNVTL